MSFDCPIGTLPRRLLQNGFVLASAIASLLLIPPAAAQRYVSRTYAEADGLASSTVWAITQDDAGRMGFATRRGLSEYDGVEWTDPTSNLGFPATEPRFLVRDARGGLWTASRRLPLEIAYRDGGSWHTIDPPSIETSGLALTHLAVSGNAEAPLVAVGIDEARILVWDGRNWSRGTTGSDSRPRPYALAAARDGLLAATSEGLFHIGSGGNGPRIEPVAGVPAEKILGVAEEGDGAGIWLVGAGWIGRVEGGQFRRVADFSVDSLFRGPVSSIVAAADRSGGLYFGNVAHVFRFDPGRGIERLGESSGLISEGATSLFVDREDNVWIGGLRGASKLTSFRFASYSREHGLLRDEVSAIVERRSGEIVLGHEHGLSFFGPPVTTLALGGGSTRGRVLDLDEDAAGHLWVAAESLGLAEIDRNRTPRWHGADEGRDCPYASVLSDHQGELWVGTNCGLRVRRGSHFVPLPLPGADLPVAIRRVFEGPSGRIYVATVRQGLFVREAGAWSHPLEDGETGACRDVFAVLERADGTAWVGALDGLCELAGGRLKKLRAPAPALNRPVYLLVEHEHALWIGTDIGVERWDGETLTPFTVEDGLIGREANRAAGVVDSRGDLWIGTERGVSVYRAELDRPSRTPPTVALLDAQAGDGRFALTSGASLRHDRNTLDLHFRAVSLLDENRVALRTWLEGLEPDWTPPYTSMSRVARYADLPPGRYRFHLRAANRDGAWSDVVSSAPIVIRRPVWGEAWFRLAALAAVMLAAFAAHAHVAQRRHARRLEVEVEQRCRELRESEERHRSILAAEKRRLEVTLGSIADGVIATDSAGRVALINPAAESITGWRSADALGRSLADVLSAPVPPRGEPFASAQPAVLVRRDGERRRIEASRAAMVDPRGAQAGHVLAFRDVTERLRIEAQSSKAQELESLGGLAGGIAHDFNNLLTVVLGHVASIRPEASGGVELRRHVESAEGAILRARDLTRQLLTFARGGAPVRQPASLTELVAEAAALVFGGSPTRVDIDMAEDLSIVEIDAGQISQLIHNLLINALQAMPDGGHVVLRGRNVQRAPSPLRSGRHIVIEVEDDGPGIAPDDLPRIFNPYFSTKPGAPGLGLATAYSIAERHDGLLTVESQRDRGTCFRVFLPASASGLPDALPASPVGQRGAGRILVMDDDEMVRDTIGHMLASRGYSVDYAAEGRQAVALYDRALRAGRRYDAVILDLTIAEGMGGRETVRHLAGLDPGVKAIMASGYSSDPLASDPARHGFAGRIDKPFRPDELCDLLQRVLESGPPAGDRPPGPA